MINIVVELSKYVILTLMIVYTVLCYYLVVGKHASDRKGLLRSQITLTFFLDFTAFVVIFLKTFDFKVVIFYAEFQGVLHYGRNQRIQRKIQRVSDWR